MKKRSYYFYENEAALYDEKRYASPLGKLMNLIQKKIVIELCNFTLGDVILDVGAGTGRFAVELAKKRGRVIGIDPSKAMIQVFDRKLKESNFHGDIELVIANAQMLPFRRNSIQQCISINVLNHIVEYYHVLNEIVRVMQIQGSFIANYPILQSVYFPVGVYVNYTKKDILQSVYSRWFTLGKIRTSYSLVGLIINENRGYFSTAFLLSNKYSRFMSRLIYEINKLVSNSALKYASGVLFIRATKTG